MCYHIYKVLAIIKLESYVRCEYNFCQLLKQYFTINRLNFMFSPIIIIIVNQHDWRGGSARLEIPSV